MRQYREGRRLPQTSEGFLDIRPKSHCQGGDKARSSLGSGCGVTYAPNVLDFERKEAVLSLLKDPFSAIGVRSTSSVKESTASSLSCFLRGHHGDDIKIRLYGLDVLRDSRSPFNIPTHLGGFLPRSLPITSLMTPRKRRVTPGWLDNRAIY